VCSTRRIRARLASCCCKRDANGFPRALDLAGATRDRARVRHAFSIRDAVGTAGCAIWGSPRSARGSRRATQRNEQAILEWKAKRWPALKKTPDETDAPSSSSTSRPERAPHAGEDLGAQGRPRAAIQLQLEAAVADRGISVWRCTSLSHGAIKGAQIVEFLKALKPHPRQAAIVWDGLPAHRSRLCARVASNRSTAISSSSALPVLRAELNPRYCSHAKQRELAKLVPWTRSKEVRR